MKSIFLSGLLLAGSYTFAQHAVHSKVDAQLKLWINHPSLLIAEQPELAKKGTDVMIPVIFKVSGGSPAAMVEPLGGVLHSVIGNICTADIPLSKLSVFVNQTAVVRVESSQPVEVHNDKAKSLVRADSVQQGFLPEGQPYTGKNVLVGIVDTGIDFLNEDFKEKNDATKTRIVAIWDQTIPGTPPAGFSYGAAWDAAQIQAAQTNGSLIDERDSSGHGTHVAGTAAGLRGIAYDANIIAVKTPLVSNGDYKFSTSAKTLDAVNYVYQQAQAMQKPCVVNMSLGFNFGAPHDGTSLFEQGLDFMLNNRGGFIICASAGNEGRDFSHHGDYALTQDSVWTYINGLNGCTWYGVNNSAQDDSLYVSVIMDSARADFNGSGITFQKKLFQTPWMNITALKQSAGGFIYPVLYGNGDTASVITITGAAYDSARSEWYVYTRDKFMVSTSTGNTHVNLFKIAFKGSGKFNAWIQALNGLGVNINNFGGDVDPRFKASDNKYVIGIPGTAKNVLTVGAFVNKRNYTDILGRIQLGLNSNNVQVGTIAFFSSNGPTMDGRVKPDFGAPGLNVASTKSRYSALDSSRMIDGNTIVYSGTSMSSPVAAGAVALFLEKYRFADHAEVKAAISGNVLKDNFTGTNLPNNIWGAGKLNIFAAMKNYQAGNEEAMPDLNGVTVFPNPASDHITMRLPGTIAAEWLTIIDVTGKTIETVKMNPTRHTIDLSGWNAGMYFYTITSGDKTVSGKFLVTR